MTGQVAGVDFADQVDLRGVHGPGQSFQVPPEVQQMIGQQFPEFAGVYLPGGGQRRPDQVVRLIQVGESDFLHTMNVDPATDSHRRPAIPDPHCRPSSR